MTIGDVCGDAVVTAHPDETVIEAARRMRDKHVGDVVVIDSDRRPVGILTDRDIVVSVIAQSPDRIQGILVGDVMTQGVITARRHETVDTVLKQMRARGIRRLPVVTSDGQLDGIVTFDDMLAVMAQELETLVGLVARQQSHEYSTRP